MSLKKYYKNLDLVMSSANFFIHTYELVVYFNRISFKKYLTLTSKTLFAPFLSCVVISHILEKNEV